MPVSDSSHCFTIYLTALGGLPMSVGPCSSINDTVDWVDVLPGEFWDRYVNMRSPYNGSCVVNVFVTSRRPEGITDRGQQDTFQACQRIPLKSPNTPDNPDMTSITRRYAGSSLQAPACRSVAASISHLNQTGFASPFLLTAAGLSKKTQAALQGKQTSGTSNPQTYSIVHRYAV